MRAIIEKTTGGLGTAIEWIVAALCGSLVLVVFANVIARYFLQTGLLWAEEVSRLIFVWTVFLGSHIAWRRKAHLAITFISDRLPPAWRRANLIVASLLIIVFLVAVVWGGLTLVSQTLEFGRVTPILGISAAWGYLSVPVAGVLMLLETVRMLTGNEGDSEPAQGTEQLLPSDRAIVQEVASA
jgi:TRAP-type C4-dicarboxylate transport system permease small subunit